MIRTKLGGGYGVAWFGLSNLSQDDGGSYYVVISGESHQLVWPGSVTAT